ncbi:hypothetical protein NQZ68_038678 [Dissostichus eleginoides]|nr:hypothetical protein NQZ68_038678 [Dissostichus eleginoides]
MEKQSKPQRRVWSDERSCCSECFSSSSSTSSSTFLLHTASQLAVPSPQPVQRGAPDKRGLGFSSSPRGPQSGGGGSSSDRAQLNQTLQHPHEPRCTSSQRGRQHRDAAALADKMTCSR